MDDVEIKNKVETIDITVEPGVIAEKYQKGEMVTRENLATFIAYCLGRGRGNIHVLSEVLGESLAAGVVTRETIEAIGNREVNPAEEELDLVYNLFKRITAHAGLALPDDKRFIWNEGVVQFSTALVFIKS